MSRMIRGAFAALVCSVVACGSTADEPRPPDVAVHRANTQVVVEALPRQPPAAPNPHTVMGPEAAPSYRRVRHGRLGYTVPADWESVDGGDMGAIIERAPSTTRGYRMNLSILPIAYETDLATFALDYMGSKRRRGEQVTENYPVRVGGRPGWHLETAAASDSGAGGERLLLQRLFLNAGRGWTFSCWLPLPEIASDRALCEGILDSVQID